MVTVRWTAESAAHIGSRGERYPAAIDISVVWANEAAADPRAIVVDPDPKSRVGAIRIVGYSPTAGFMITMVVRRIDGEMWGDSAWKTTGAERRAYKEAGRGEA